mmetsp:Transcript_35570/g.82613  ORF Transcript_35570/g.82613 Transcript_35570/m.82613 type:complete len:502 (-) Transcript_35570:436-1941(-)
MLLGQLHHSSSLLFPLLALVAFLPTGSSGLASAVPTMVEGHSVHRVASRFRQDLVGRRFRASSPNGRFAEGAAAIDGATFSGIEAVGKNLFAFFSDGVGAERRHVCHVHFGMSGVWSVHYDGEEPDPRPTCRLRLREVGGKTAAHLSCMTLTYGGPELYSEKRAALGEDPLRADADPDILYEKIVKMGMQKGGGRSVGRLIMDQALFAGPGNIYRAEILFLAGVDPETTASALSRDDFDRVWQCSVDLLRRGYDTGSIVTVDPNLDPEVVARGIRRYVYNRSKCGRCGAKVLSWDMAGRTCYACGGSCQKKFKKEGKKEQPKHAVKKKTPKKRAHSEVPLPESSPQTLPPVGSRIGIYWPDDATFYPAIVSTAPSGRGSKIRVDYDDGEFEMLHLNKEAWQYLDSPPTRKMVSVNPSKEQRVSVISNCPHEIMSGGGCHENVKKLTKKAQPNDTAKKNTSKKDCAHSEVPLPESIPQTLPPVGSRIGIYWLRDITYNNLIC